jgi:integrase
MGTVYRAKTKRRIPPQARIEEKRGQRYAVWKGRHGKECRHKVTAEGDRIVYESEYYTIEFGAGINRHREVTSFRDRDSAKTYMRQLEERAAKRKSGLPGARLEDFEEQLRRPIAEHIADFVAVRKASDRTEKYVAGLTRHLDFMVREMGIETLADITATGVRLALGRMKDSGKALRTCNAHLTTLKGFLKWCRMDGRLVDDILLAVEPYDHETDPRHARRAPLLEEIHRLLAAARARTADHCQFFGEDRAKAYEIAIMTGYRANEIRSLTPECFSLDGDHPCITVRPTISKRRRLDIQPIPQSFVESIREWIAGKPRGVRLFEAMPGDTARMLRSDLDIARKAWIAEGATEAEQSRRKETDFLVYENSVGEYFDFHACRHAYITFISETTKSLKQAQTLARVSTPRLLDRYSHIQLHGVQQAADAIGAMITGSHRPGGNRREAASPALAATGTDDATPDPDPATGRGASRGSSTALGGRRRHTVAGWVKNADAAPATISMPDPAPNPSARQELAPAGTGRHARRVRGSGRSRTDDGGFAMCPSGKSAISRACRTKLGPWGYSVHVKPAVAVSFGGFEPTTEVEEIIPKPARLHAIDGVAEIADELFEFEATHRHDLDLLALGTRVQLALDLREWIPVAKQQRLFLGRERHLDHVTSHG